MVSVFSLIFSSVAQGNGYIANLVDEVRLNLEKLGSEAIMPRFDVDSVLTARSRRRKEDRDNDAARHLVHMLTPLDQAFADLHDTKDKFDDRMDKLEERLERRIDAIDDKLNDPDIKLLAEERAKLMEERRQLQIIQQEMIDERQRIEELMADLARRRANGEEIDPGEVKDVEQDLKDTADKYEQQFNQAYPEEPAQETPQVINLEFQTANLSF